MKKIKFSVTKCINTKCGFNIISDPVKRNCPICGSKMIKDRNYSVNGYDDKDTNDTFIGFKKRKNNGNHNRPKKIKNNKS